MAKSPPRGRAAERAAFLATDAGALIVAGCSVHGADCVGCATTATCLAGALPALGVLGLYRPRLQLSSLEDAPRLAAGVITGSSLALALLWAVDAPYARASRLMWALVTAVACVVLGRAAGYAVVRSSRARHDGRLAVIVGTGRVAAYLARVLTADRSYGLAPVGHLTGGGRLDGTPLPVLGDTDDLPRLIERAGVEHVLVAFSDEGEDELVEVLRGVRRDGVDVLCVPRLFEIHPGTRAAEQVGVVPLIRLRRADRAPAAHTVKRLVDVVVAGGALILLAPAFALCALAARIEGGPGVLFRQERLGRDAVPFTLLKFRSLRPADQDESATLWSVAEDRRIGRVGRLLRKTSLDELPQLVNVVRGEMSLVGPRPERPHFVAEFSRRYAGYRHRHRAEVGLTGWSQVNGLRGPTSIEDRALLDNWYIEHWSPWLDVKIVLRTLGVVLRDLRGPRR